jgi:hypothetical protein
MAPRSKKSELKDATGFRQTFDQNRFLILPGKPCLIVFALRIFLVIVYLFLDSLTNDQNIERKFVKLRHPQTSELAMFVFSEKDKKLAQMRSLPFDHRYIHIFYVTLNCLALNVICFTGQFSRTMK